jgi:hypothetical protein
MSKAIEQIVRESIRKVIDRSITNSEIRRSFELHNSKVHFVPARYRVLGGILQSLNIKFGNFIEVLVRTIVDDDPKVTLHEYSGRRTALSFSARTDALIDRYITTRQLPNSADKCDDEYSELIDKILQSERQPGEKETFNRDIDCLFKDKDGNFVYAELKYNDDHDNGKLVVINRKFPKTRAGLINLLKIKNCDELRPYIYYLNPTKRWGNIHCPSSTVLRGPQLFDIYISRRNMPT